MQAPLAAVAIAAGRRCSRCRGAASAQTTLNVVTAGDQNMVDYVNNYLGPKFEAMNPGVKVRAVGTGPGDGGSQKIYEKLSAQQKAGTADVGHRRRRRAPARRRDDGQREAADAVSQRRRRRQARLARHREERARRERRRLRAADVPQPDRVRVQPRPRQGAAEVVSPSSTEWVKKNPKQFGYNGVKGGMSGVGFVMGWVVANSGIGDKLEKGPYDAGDKAAIDKSLAGLKDFNQYVVMTPGNAGTLDMLNRGEIAMGPVWVDMFYTWQADGKMSPKIKLALPSPGLPGPADVLRDSGQGGERRDREEVHRLRREPRSAGRRHRQAVQLVSGHRSAVRAGEARRRRRGTSSSPTSRRPSCEERPPVPAVAITSPTSSKGTSASC